MRSPSGRPCGLSNSAQDNQKIRQSRADYLRRIRLGGVDRVIFDRDDDAPWERYAHIYESAISTNLHDMPTTDPDVAYQNSAWRRVGIIDLDTGDLVDAP